MTIERLPLRGRRARLVWQAAPWERFEARGVIASAIALAALAAGATAGGAAVSAGIQSHAASKSAETQAKATSDATAQQLQYEREALAAQQKATEEQLAYTKGQASQNRADAETTREGDYEQWAAREGRLSTIGGMLGLPARQIPSYRALGPEGGGPGAAPAANLMPKQGEVDWSAPPDALAQQLTGYFKARGVGDKEVPYYVGKAGELVARGKEINDPGYADRRLAAAEIFGGSPYRTTAGSSAPYGSIGSMAPPPSSGYGVNTPAYVAPRFAPAGSIRQFAAMA